MFFFNIYTLQYPIRLSGNVSGDNAYSVRYNITHALFIENKLLHYKVSFSCLKGTECCYACMYMCVVMALKDT